MAWTRRRPRAKHLQHRGRKARTAASSHRRRDCVHEAAVTWPDQDDPAGALEFLARQGVTLGLHICRGNSRSRWFSEGSYDSIAEELFGTIGVDKFLLEYDAPAREGGFEPLRFLPPGKTAVLGLVTTKEPA